MSDGRMQTAGPKLAAEVVQWLAQAAASDAREDAAYGVDWRGDELPEWVTHTPHRGEKIRAAKATWEAEVLARKEAALLWIALAEAVWRRIRPACLATAHSASSPIRTVAS